MSPHSPHAELENQRRAEESREYVYCTKSLNVPPCRSSVGRCNADSVSAGLDQSLRRQTAPESLRTGRLAQAKHAVRSRVLGGVTPRFRFAYSDLFTSRVLLESVVRFRTAPVSAGLEISPGNTRRSATAIPVSAHHIVVSRVRALRP